MLRVRHRLLMDLPWLRYWRTAAASAVDGNIGGGRSEERSLVVPSKYGHDIETSRMVGTAVGAGFYENVAAGVAAGGTGECTAGLWIMCHVCVAMMYIEDGMTWIVLLPRCIYYFLRVIVMCMHRSMLSIKEFIRR